MLRQGTCIDTAIRDHGKGGPPATSQAGRHLSMALLLASPHLLVAVAAAARE
jgi:hypothetical protein